LDIHNPRDAAPDFLVEGESKRPRRLILERIGHSHDESSLAFGEQDYPRLLQEHPPNALGTDWLGREFRRRDEGRPDQLGIGSGDIALGNETEFGGDAVDPLAAFGFEPPGSFRNGRHPIAANEKPNANPSPESSRTGRLVSLSTVRVELARGDDFGPVIRRATLRTCSPMSLRRAPVAKASSWARR